MWTEGDGRGAEGLHSDLTLPGLGLSADHHHHLASQEPLDARLQHRQDEGYLGDSERLVLG